MLPYQRPEIITYSNLLAESYQRWTGRPMPGITGSGEALAKQLYEAPFPLVSHGTEADPIFRYANRAALELWGMDWDKFTRLPSRQSAENEGAVQEDRQQLLKQAMQKGWVDDYRGTRISKNGKRFEIDKTTLWNVVDARGHQHGQAALIGEVRHLSATKSR